MSTEASYIGTFRQDDPVEREYFPDRPPVLDPARLKSLAVLEATGCRGLVQEVVATFLDTVPRSLTALKDAFLRGDSATGERIAHSLRGNCGLLGAPRMAEWAGRIEESAWLSGNEADEVIGHLNAEWPPVQATLQNVLAQGLDAVLGVVVDPRH
jgi:HPt (histidine-containing phosphotransfer) domain-containing protein